MSKRCTRSGSWKLPVDKRLHITIQVILWSVFQVPVYLCYVNEVEFKVFHAGNCDELKPENIKKRIPTIIQRAKVRQNIMKISNDPNVLKDYIQPDFTHMFWNNDADENYLKNAKKFWGY